LLRSGADKIHLLFNNAGIGGGGNMVVNSREVGRRSTSAEAASITFWAFLPMPEGRQGHRQYEQRQRFLGIHRTAYSAPPILRRNSQ
jgi:hypothetical protein